VTNRWCLGLSPEHCRCDKQWSVVGNIVYRTLRSAAENVFKVHSCAYKNGSREQNHAPFRGDLSSLWQDLIWSLASAIPGIWMRRTSRRIDHIAQPSEYNNQPTSIGDQQIAMQTKKCVLLPHIWTQMLKLHLIDLLSMLYSQLCKKYSDKSNRWNLGLSHTKMGHVSKTTSLLGVIRHLFGKTW